MRSAVAVHWEILAQWCDEILLLLPLCLDSARATPSVRHHRGSAPRVAIRYVRRYRYCWPLWVELDWTNCLADWTFGLWPQRPHRRRVDLDPEAEMKDVGRQRHQEILRADLDLPPLPAPADRGDWQCAVAGVLSRKAFCLWVRSLHHQWALPWTVAHRLQVDRLRVDRLQVGRDEEDQTIRRVELGL